MVPPRTCREGARSPWPTIGCAAVLIIVAGIGFLAWRGLSRAAGYKPDYMRRAALAKRVRLVTSESTSVLEPDDPANELLLLLKIMNPPPQLAGPRGRFSIAGAQVTANGRACRTKAFASLRVSGKPAERVEIHILVVSVPKDARDMELRTPHHEPVPFRPSKDIAEEIRTRLEPPPRAQPFTR